MSALEFGQFKRELKRTLGNYTTWTPKLERSLKSLGFDIKSKRKHAILYYETEKKKLVFVISKTPSDKRAGLNNVGIICRSLLSQQ